MNKKGTLQLASRKLAIKLEPEMIIGHLVIIDYQVRYSYRKENIKHYPFACAESYYENKQKNM